MVRSSISLPTFSYSGDCVYQHIMVIIGPPLGFKGWLYPVIILVYISYIISINIYSILRIINQHQPTSTSNRPGPARRTCFARASKTAALRPLRRRPELLQPWRRAGARTRWTRPVDRCSGRTRPRRRWSGCWDGWKTQCFSLGFIPEKHRWFPEKTNPMIFILISGWWFGTCCNCSIYWEFHNPN